MKATERETCVRAYMDDAYSTGRGADVGSAVDTWVERTRQNGGEPNLSKSKVYYNHPSLKDEAKTIADKHGFTLVGPDGGLVVAGTPVGSAEFVAKMLAEAVQSHERLWKHLPLMDPQAGALINRYSSLPRFNHIARAVPVNQALPHTRAFDKKCMEVNRSLFDQSRSVSPLEMQLPGRLGGLGYRQVSSTLGPANLSSLTLVLPILMESFPILKSFVNQCKKDNIPDDTGFVSVDVAKAMAKTAHDSHNHIFGWMCDAWIRLRELGVAKDLPGDPRLLVTGFYEQKMMKSDLKRPFKIQRALTRSLEAVMATGLVDDSVPPPDRARILSNSDSGASAWGHTRPTKLRLALSPHEYAMAVAIRNGTALTAATVAQD